MNKKELKIFLRLYWIRVLLVLLGALAFLALVVVMIVGTISFFSLESFYQQSMLAAMPSQIFFVLSGWFHFCGDQHRDMDVFYVWRRFCQDGQKKVKANRSTLNGQMSSYGYDQKGSLGKRLTLLRIELSLNRSAVKSLKVF